MGHAVLLMPRSVAVPQGDCARSGAAPSWGRGNGVFAGLAQPSWTSLATTVGSVWRASATPFSSVAASR